MINALATLNPYYAARLARRAPANLTTERQAVSRPVYAVLPQAPRNASPVPGLTSLYHSAEAGPYGDRGYPGNCGGNLIRDLLKYFQPATVFDPMTGSGTCRDVCRELGVYCWSADLRGGFNLAAPAAEFPRECFEFCWIHPPYWRQKLYTDRPGDLSRAADFDAFLGLYEAALRNAAAALLPGGKLAVLMGEYSDREAGFVPLTYHTKRLCFGIGLRQHCTDIIRFSHGASSGKKVYRSSFIPGLHDVCMVFEKGGDHA